MRVRVKGVRVTWNTIFCRKCGTRPECLFEFGKLETSYFNSRVVQ